MTFRHRLENFLLQASVCLQSINVFLDLERQYRARLSPAHVTLWGNDWLRVREGALEVLIVNWRLFDPVLLALESSFDCSAEVEPETREDLRAIFEIGAQIRQKIRIHLIYREMLPGVRGDLRKVVVVAELVTLVGQLSARLTALEFRGEFPSMEQK